jgi:hypothetical protein
VSERSKELASKASVGETQPWVRIPPSPPFVWDQRVRAFLNYPHRFASGVETADDWTMYEVATALHGERKEREAEQKTG